MLTLSAVPAKSFPAEGAGGVRDEGGAGGAVPEGGGAVCGSRAKLPKESRSCVARMPDGPDRAKLYPARARVTLNKTNASETV